MVSADLTVDALPLGAVSSYNVQRLPTGQMNQVDRAFGEPGQSDDPVGCLGLGQGRPAAGVVARFRLALGQQLLFEILDNPVVFGVYDR